jgi:L,D-transpeptidase ErfK/SrfK
MINISIRRHRRGWLYPAAAAILLVALGGCAGDSAAPRPLPDAAAPRANVAPTGKEAKELVGHLETVAIDSDDSLLDVAVRNRLGYLQVAAANPRVDPWLPQQGAQVLLPKASILPQGGRDGLVINLPERRLYYFRKRALVSAFPVGLGRDGLETPRGATRVVRKAKNPAWQPTALARRDDPDLPAYVPPGADNPLGTRAIYLGWPNYLIHGTNRVYAIGRRASRGCIRLYNSDVEALFDQVPVGTPVRVIDEPVKVGWYEGELFIEAHPSIRQGAQLETTGRIAPARNPDVRSLLRKKAGAHLAAIDWSAVEAALQERRGVPTQITRLTGMQPLTPRVTTSGAASMPVGDEKQPG